MVQMLQLEKKYILMEHLLFCYLTRYTFSFITLLQFEHCETFPTRNIITHMKMGIIALQF